MTRSLNLPSSARAPGTARSFVRETLETWGVDELGDVAELLTDELVSNVVSHVGSPMEIRASRRGSSIRIEVDDASTEPPVRRDPDPLDDHGRGMVFVDQLAARWGFVVRAGGKTTWFEISA